MSFQLGISLPQNWVWSPLKFATVFLNRGTSPDYADDGSVRAISQAANQATKIDWTRTRFHRHEGDPSKLKGYLSAGDVLINSTGTGTLGRVGYFAGGPDSTPCMADSHVTVARANKRAVDPKYLYYWLTSTLFYKYIYSELIVGATNQIELNRERLAAASIALPPLEEQRRIVNFLDIQMMLADELVSIRSRQVGLLAAHEKSWRNRLFADSGSGKWVRVKHILRARPRYGVLVPRFVDNGIPFVRVNNLPDLIRDELAMIPEEISGQYPRTVTTLGDVLLSVVGTLGKTAVVSEDLVGVNTARAVAVLRLNRNHSPSLLATWFGTQGFERQALLATGSDSAQPTLGMEDLSNFAIRWPEDDAEQQAMTAASQERQHEIAEMKTALNRQLSLLNERRRALITAAVTGQIDVTTARGLPGLDGVKV